MAGFLDAARTILEEEGKPLHGKEIVKRARDRGLFTTRSATDDPWQLIRSITSDIKRGGNPRHMVILGKGVYGLEDWGPAQDIPTQAGLTRPRQLPPPAAVVSSGITIEMLEQTRQMMPQEQFQQIWGRIYDLLLAEERTKGITPVNDRFLADKARPLVRRIQDFLQGRGNDIPMSEAVCDWIFLCYTLELFREGAALWRYVNKDEVSGWQYERSNRLATACRQRVAGS